MDSSTAGTDTTANTLGWAVWYLATNPDVQNDARQKIIEYLLSERLHEKSEEEVVYVISRFCVMIDHDDPKQ